MIRTARPRKTGLDYFPHNVDAVNDEKIEAMRALYGNDGYAFYFILLERIYRNSGVLDVNHPAILTAIQRRVTLDTDLWGQMLKSAFDLRLFDAQKYSDEHVLTSAAILKKAGFIDRERSRKRAYSRAQREREVSDVQNAAETASIGRVHPPQSKGKERKEYIPPISPGGGCASPAASAYDELFLRFWSAYPKKKSKATALKAWKKIKPDEGLLEIILTAIENQRRTDQWQKEGGQFIPYPATWLNAHGWEDETAQGPAIEKWSELT